MRTGRAMTKRLRGIHIRITDTDPWSGTPRTRTVLWWKRAESLKRLVQAQDYARELQRDGSTAVILLNGEVLP